MSEFHIKNSLMRVVRILEVDEATLNLKTLVFEDEVSHEAEPGQFLMVWIPGLDEIPMSISRTWPDGKASFTVAGVGKATESLCNKRPGELIGVRGPFGNHFSLSSGKVLIIGGGTGVAPLAFLTEKLVDVSQHITFLLGAKSRDHLLFLSRIRSELSKGNNTLIPMTDNGTYGIHGMVTDQLPSIITDTHFDMIYTCGPEPMMYAVFDHAEKHSIPIQASLERLMRCAIGLCGSCAIGKYLVCRDGPVFTSAQIREVQEEFGISRRDHSGTTIHVGKPSNVRAHLDVKH